MTGRKPLPSALVDSKKHKKSKENISKRAEIELSLETDKFLKCPSHLTKDAKKEWKRVMNLYNQMSLDILSDLDRQALIMYCEAISMYNLAQRDWRLLIKQKDEVMEFNPESIEKIKTLDLLIESVANRMNRQTKIISPLTEQLCLTPVGRARMGVLIINPKEEDELDQLEKSKNGAMN